LTGNSGGLIIVLSSHLSHRELRSSLRKSQFPQLTCRHHDGIISRHSIHSAGEHRMICSFSNTTSYSTFYALFSSFRITLWPMWLTNDSLVFIHHIYTHKKTHRINPKKTDKPDGKPVLCQRTFSSVFLAVFFTQFNLRVYGALLTL
jgi:hypothetical protein